MKYTVIRQPSAVEQLADIWINSTERAAVTHIVERIDTSLGYEPHNVGESRDANRRVLRYTGGRAARGNHGKDWKGRESGLVMEVANAGRHGGRPLQARDSEFRGPFCL